MPTQIIKPIHRRQVSQALIDRLLSMISEGYWMPGEKLPPLRELAASLGVGMSTLREALQSLQTMGILKMLHGDGTYLEDSPSQVIYSHMVTVSLAMSKNNMQMLFDARGVIETGFAFFAAEHATEEQIKKLFQILEDERQAILDSSHDQIHSLDLEFHKTIAEIADNDFLQQIIDSLFTALDEILQIIPQTMEGWRWHYNVAVEIRNHDPMRASEAMRTLVNASGARLLPYFAGEASS